MDDLTATCAYYAPMQQVIITIPDMPRRGLPKLTQVLSALRTMASVTVENDTLRVVANNEHADPPMRDIQAAICLAYRDNDIQITYIDNGQTKVLQPDGAAYPAAIIRDSLERRDYDKWLERHGFVGLSIIVTRVDRTARLYELIGIKDIRSDTAALNRAIDEAYPNGRANWTDQTGGRVTMFSGGTDNTDWIQRTHAGVRRLVGRNRQVVLRSETATKVNVILPDGKPWDFYKPFGVGDITNVLEGYLPENATK